MRLAVALASLCLLACPAEEDDFPSGTPGDKNPPGDGEGPIDAGDIDAGDAGPVGVDISGVICRVNDVRQPTTCTNINNADITVRLDGTNVAADVDSMGRFTLPKQLGSAGERVVLTATQNGPPFTYATAAATVRLDAAGAAGNIKLRTILTEDYELITEVNMLPVQEGSGHIFVRVIDGAGVPVSDGVLSPAAGEDPYYDTGDPVIFSQFLEPVTGDFGFAAYLNVPASASVPFSVDTEALPGVEYTAPAIASGVTFYTAVYDPEPAP